MQDGLRLKIPFEEFEREIQSLIDSGYALFSVKVSTQKELEVLRNNIDDWEEKVEQFLLSSFNIARNIFYLEFTHRPGSWGRKLSLEEIIEKAKYRIQKGANNLEKTKIACERFKPDQHTKLKPKEIHVFIASPSDAYHEREVLLNSLETKFRREGFENYCGVRVIVHGWEELASQPGYVQDIINSKLLDKTDIIIAIFRHKLGSPTIDPITKKVRAKSGTVEEMLYSIRTNKKTQRPVGMVYFFSEPPVMAFDNRDFDSYVKNWKELNLFKDEIKNDILFKKYENPEDLVLLCCNDLCKNIISYF